MRKLIVFNNVSLDGFSSDKNGGIGWFKQNRDPEWLEFVEGNAKGDGVLMFGRKTYELMASYWPTPMAAQNDPIVAKQMNLRSKIVFSKTLRSVSWENTTLVKGDAVTEMRKLKSQAGKDMVILGSPSLVAPLADAGLIDEFQLVVYPIVLGQGRSMFQDLTQKLSLQLTKTRVFRNGNVLLTYQPLNKE